MTSPQFEYNTLKPCIETPSPALGVAETHRFGTADMSNCACGWYLRSGVLNPARHMIKKGALTSTTIDRAWLIDFFEKTTTRMVDTMKKKNADYGGAVPDPFANFVQVETLGIATAEQGFLTRMTDKLCRVASFAKNGELQVKDESVSDTLLDLANYSLLMMAYLESKKVK